MCVLHCILYLYLCFMRDAMAKEKSRTRPTVFLILVPVCVSRAPGLPDALCTIGNLMVTHSHTHQAASCICKHRTDTQQRCNVTSHTITVALKSVDAYAHSPLLIKGRLRQPQRHLQCRDRAANRAASATTWAPSTCVGRRVLHRVLQ